MSLHTRKVLRKALRSIRRTMIRWGWRLDDCGTGPKTGEARAGRLGRMSREAVAASGSADGTASLDGSPLPARHMLAAPLLLGHRMFGVVYLDRGLGGEAFTADDVDILTAVGDHLALALEAAHTERLESERRALTRSQEAALDATRAKSAFIAHMSHELRTPLTAIIGYSELLEEEFQDQGQSPYIPDVQRIQSAAKHLLALINNMLDLSKIEAGKMELHVEEFDLAEVLDEAVMAILPLLERGGNSFIRRVQPGMGPVWLDRMKVRWGRSTCARIRTSR